MRSFSNIELAPAYALSDAAFYLRLSRGKVERWARALGPTETDSVDLGFVALSYVNLLELHVLKAMRLKHEVPLQRIRKALSFLRGSLPTPHPLLDRDFSTNGLDLFFEHDGDLINASRGGQRAIRQVVNLYLSRIDWRATQLSFFPFVQFETETEPKHIEIRPTVSFGRPVLAGTGIAAEVVAGRFRARESSQDLASEYNVPLAVIEEAVRWEMPRLDAA
jgi:uncharacterized protein (DUF433 family)